MAPATYEIRDAEDADVPRVTAFLEEHVETSLFLLNNVVECGPRLTDELNSGNLRLIEEDGRIAGVFALNRRGVVLAETAGRTAYTEAILDWCRRDPIAITGTTGEWTTAESVWTRIRDSGGVEPTLESKEVLYGLELPVRESREPDGRTRPLTPEDFELWVALQDDYLTEIHVPVTESSAVRRRHFIRQATRGHWWGRFDGPRLLAMAGLNASYRNVGQVGGVFTPLEERGRGHARSVMELLIGDCRNRLGMDRLILFTDEGNESARRLYEGLGFRSIGWYGLLLGTLKS